MREIAILLVYGEGGHRTEMKRLYSLLKEENKSDKYKFIGICENTKMIIELDENYSIRPLRDKYSNLITLINIPISILNYIKLYYKLIKKYEIVSVISSGPGIAIPISLFFKLLGKKIIFIEDWCRFESMSTTGRIMYKIADKFYIQNKSLQKYYPNAIYGGLL